MIRKDLFTIGEYYHIYNRGVDKRVIFKNSHDYSRFIMLLYLANSQDSFRLDQLINIQHKSYEEILLIEKGKSLVSIGAWCLMPNHFHLLIREEVEGGVTKFMKKLCTAYSMYFNIKNNRSGSLLQGRFKSKLVEKDNYMMHLFGYIHLNSLDLKFSKWEENIARKPKDMREFLKSYKYSSYQDYVQVKRPENKIINFSRFPDYFMGDKEFKNFVESYFIINDIDEFNITHARTVLA